MKTPVILLFLLIAVKSIAQQAYFYDQFDYQNISELEADSIWDSRYLKYVDLSEDGVVDDYENFKIIEFIKDPIDETNNVIRLDINRADATIYNLYKWDGPDSEFGPLTTLELDPSNTYDCDKQLYCGGLNQPVHLDSMGDTITAVKHYRNQMNRIEIIPHGHPYNISQEYWFHWKMMLDSSYQLDVNKGELNSEILAQFHVTQGCDGPPPISLQIIDEKWYLRVPSLDDTTTTTEINESLLYIDDVEKNTWIDWKINLNLSSDSTGFVEVWKDSISEIHKSNLITFPYDTSINNCNPNYNFKLGIYKSSWWECGAKYSEATRKVIYIDDVWASSNDLDESGFTLSLKPQDQNDTINVSDMEISTYNVPEYEYNFKFKFVKKSDLGNIRYVHPSGRTVDLYKLSDYLEEETIYNVYVRIPDHPIFNEYGPASEIYIDDLELELKTQYQNETFEVLDSVATYELGGENIEYKFRLKEVGDLSNEKFYISNSRFLPLDSIQSWLPDSIQVEVQAKNHPTFGDYGPKQYFYFDSGSGSRISNEYVLNTEEEPIDFQIFPNPTENVITIKSSLGEKSTIRLMDFTGKVLLETEINSFPVNLDVSKLQNGTYLLKIGNYATRKIILEK